MTPRTRAARVGIYAAAKALLNLLRTIPKILWALIFVFMVGLGPSRPPNVRMQVSQSELQRLVVSR